MLIKENEYVLKNLNQHLFNFEISSIFSTLNQVLMNMLSKYYHEEYDTEGMRLYIRAEKVYREMLMKENNNRIITDIKQFLETEYFEFPINELIEWLEGQIKYFEDNPHYLIDDFTEEILMDKIKLMSLNGTLPQNKDSKNTITYKSY